VQDVQVRHALTVNIFHPWLAPVRLWPVIWYTSAHSALPFTP
jgi:hypothetical protein